MRRFLSSIAVVICGGHPRSSAFVTEQSKTSGRTPDVERSSLDRKADPCVDFYQFACGGWVAANPLPADRGTYGRFAELQARNFAILRRVLESPSPSAGVDARKAADFYAACMDIATIERKALT